jgi:hypothetical protein
MSQSAFNAALLLTMSSITCTLESGSSNPLWTRPFFSQEAFAGYLLCAEEVGFNPL